MENAYTENVQYENTAVCEQPVYTPPAQDNTTKVAGTGSFIGLILLFAIPIVGFISCLVMAFAVKNKNIKNFAKATLFWQIITILILALLIAALVMAINSLIQTTVEKFGATIEDIRPLIDLFLSGKINISQIGELVEQLQNADLDPEQLEEIFEQIKNGDMSEIRDILDKIPSDKIDSVIDQIPSDEIGVIIDQIPTGEIPTLG